MGADAAVLILGGTAEARELAELLAADPRIRPISSLAGRVTAPHRPAGELRIGGFDGPDGLAQWLAEHRIAVLVDATHPFAATISRHAVQASIATGVPLVRLCRPGWQPGPGDRWHPVESGEQAATLLPELGERVFLTTGSYQLDAFVPLSLWFLLRFIEPPQRPLPARHQLLLQRGPFTVTDELALLREHRIDVLVTKNSGGSRTSAKLAAARTLQLPVLLLERPAPPGSASATEVADVPAAVAAIAAAAAGETGFG